MNVKKEHFYNHHAHKCLQEFCRKFDSDLKRKNTLRISSLIFRQSICDKNGDQILGMRIKIGIKVGIKYWENMIKFNWISFIHAFLIGHFRFFCSRGGG